MTNLNLWTNTKLGKQVLMYAYNIIKKQRPEGPETFEYLYDQTLPFMDFIPREKRKDIKIIIIGNGTHTCNFEHHDLNISVEFYGNPIKLLDNDDILKKVTISFARDIPVNGNEILIRFVESAKKYSEELVEEYMINTIQTKKYLFNSKYGDWEALNTSKCRNISTVFLPSAEKKQLYQLLSDIKNDVIRTEYERFQIPYKINILLYGVPGSGKSSTISAIAAELNSDVAIMQLSNEINDTTLIQAVNRLVSLDKCKILVMEDIDCLFENRKTGDTERSSMSLSGLLNVLDGMSRAEGLVVILTANNVQSLDSAMLRAGRIDLRIKYSYVCEEQLRDMMHHYFENISETIINEMWSAIGHKEVSTCMLQQYFFNMRHSAHTELSMSGNIKKLMDLKPPKQTSHDNMYS